MKKITSGKSKCIKFLICLHSIGIIKTKNVEFVSHFKWILIHIEKDGTRLRQFSEVTVSESKINIKLFILRKNVQNELQNKF